MNSNKISTLICAYLPTEDHADMFHRAFQSIERQSRMPDEIVVVLDGLPKSGFTRDSVLEFLEEKKDYHTYGSEPYPEIKVYNRPKKEGLAVAKNFGLQHCTGDWITYLDADDEWMPCKLEVQEQYVNALEVDFCFTQAWDSFNGLWKPNCFKVGQYETHDQIAAALPHENVLCHGSAMIQRAVLNRLGGYGDVRGMEDWDLWKRAMLAGFRFYNVPERLYIYSLNTSVPR